MKLKKEFLTHKTMGEHFIVPTSAAEFKGIVQNNETAAFIVELLKSDITENEIVDRILVSYSDADRQTVTEDVTDILNKLRSIDALAD